jgi:hypothetical protein
MRFCKRVSYLESVTVKNPLDFNRASRIVSADSQNAPIAPDPFWLNGKLSKSSRGCSGTPDFR